MDDVARGQHLDDGAGGLVRRLQLEEGLVEIMIEGGAQGLDALDAVALENRQHLALDQLHPLGEPVEECVRPPPFGRDGVEDPAQVVGGGDEIRGELGDGVFGRVLGLLAHAPARVLGLGEGAQELILELGTFRLEIGDLLRRRQRLFARPGRGLALGPTRPLGRGLLGHLVFRPFVRFGHVARSLHALRGTLSFGSAEHAPDHLGGIVDHGDDARVIDARRADHADRTHDLLAAVAEGGDDHRAARVREEDVLGPYEDLHALGDPRRLDQA